MKKIAYLYNLAEVVFRWFLCVYLKNNNHAKSQSGKS